MTIDLCVCIRSVKVLLHNILLWVLTTATDEHNYLVRGLLYLYIPTLAASVFTPSINGFFLSGKYACIYIMCYVGFIDHET